MQKVHADTVDMMECALKHVEIQMDNLLLAMGDDPLSPEVRKMIMFLTNGFSRSSFYHLNNYTMFFQEQSMPRRQTNPDVSPSSATATIHPRLSTMPSLSSSSPRERSSALDEFNTKAVDTISKLTVDGN